MYKKKSYVQKEGCQVEKRQCYIVSHSALACYSTTTALENYSVYCLNHLTREGAFEYLSGMALCLTLLVLTVNLPTSHLYSIKNLLQFENMIECTKPDSSPLLDYADYGCFCGLGGSGTPVDQLDRCCFTHDACYGTAETLPSCSSVFDSPYTNTYDYKCDKNTKTLTCLDSNDECDMFICKCDKAAAECFAQAPYNSSNNHLSSSVCSSASRETSSFLITLSAFTITLTLIYQNKIPCKS